MYLEMYTSRTLPTKFCISFIFNPFRHPDGGIQALRRTLQSVLNLLVSPPFDQFWLAWFKIYSRKKISRLISIRWWITKLNSWWIARIATHVHYNMHCLKLSWNPKCIVSMISVSEEFKFDQCANWQRGLKYTAIVVYMVEWTSMRKRH